MSHVANGNMPETGVAALLEAEFARLGPRFTWYPQVDMLCWTHSLKGSADRLRIDYVAQIDNGAIIGIEAKAAPQHPRDFGRALFPCSQYAHGYIAPATVDRVPPGWIGKPLTAVFLWSKWNEMPPHLASHGQAAHRLYGPANVGFMFRTTRRLEMRLCGERFWCELYGFHKGQIVEGKVHRSGNGTFRAVNGDS